MTVRGPLLPIALLPIALVSSALVSSALPAAADAASAGEPVVIAGVAEVVDAGTLAVDGVTLRLAGLVAPGPRQKCLDGNLPWLCGAAARQHLAKLVGDRPVRCETVTAGVARCRAGDLDLAAAMIRDGWAVAGRDGEAYRPLEAEAREARRGLWEKAP
ncbi:hypothetical protein GCM10017083_19230 [Thalassobaculum fulvum]|uniref:TNase-like domain-containing protein n=1 Tax=Thalassobaculum fulvum TaxID=1633335 RepID=A0A919CQF3_9PROT|nr:thermonuclease family protein [Thalassobaculum fulvum]GHD48314.1 hypothetical protein GCM10017083_19230 [Thalassobaculum fulvum]